jgi:acyl carrier protein
VRDAVVLLRTDPPGDPRLVAYVVQGSGVRDQGSGSEDKQTSRQADKAEPNVTLSPGHLVTLSAPRPPTPDPRPLVPDLRDFLKAKLPSYMMPAAFVVLEALPLTANGKLDRRALPAPTARLDTSPTFEPPATSVEQKLADIWAEVLGIDRIGAHDSFFELGGYSLLGVQMLARVRETFQVEVPFSKLFETPTIRGLAEVIDQYIRVGAGIQQDRIEVAPRGDRTIEQLLADLAQLSDAESQALLRNIQPENTQ